MNNELKYDSKDRPLTPPERCPKCGATERLTVAVTRPEDEKNDQDDQELERAAALKYGVDLEAGRRQRFPSHEQLRNRYHGALLGLAVGSRALGLLPLRHIRKRRAARC